MSFPIQYEGAAAQKFCSDCGASIALRAEICPECGVRQMAPPPMQYSGSHARKSRTTAALLALFLGGLGVHHFYYGNVGRGVLYFLFCWTLIPGIIAFFEFIGLLIMSDEEFDARHNRVPTLS